MVDISSPDTFVLSANHSSRSPEAAGYNVSSSSTGFREPNPTLSIEGPLFVVDGDLTQDVFRFPGVDVQNQSFIDANRVEIPGLSWDDLSVMSAVLGLTPSGAAGVTGRATPLSNMGSQNLLKEEVFSLRLRAPAQLSFRGVDDRLYEGEIVKLQLTDLQHPEMINGRWQTPINFLAVGDDPGYRLGLDGHTAFFSTTFQYLHLPDKLVWSLLEDLEFEDIMMMPPSVDCSRRSTLPNLTFNLAGHNFTLTPYDYTSEWPLDHGEKRCVSTILGSITPGEDVVALGSAFLRAFYSVFDLGERTIGRRSSNMLRNGIERYH